MKYPPSHLKKVLLATIGAALLVIAAGYGGYRFYKLRLELREEKTVLGGKVLEIQKLRKQSAELKESLASARADLASAASVNSSLTQSLQAEQAKNGIFEGQINEISGTVGELKKLSTIDPQLLQKYSKVYFLSENYAPSQLSAVDSAYIYDKNKTQLFLSGARPFLESMIASAKRDGVTLQVVSAYRSFYEQISVKSGYQVIYGSGANQFSADQGYSEHQLGTAADFTSPEAKGVFSKFEGAAAYKWLSANAYKSGFILSYPKNNVYYQFEPWHWRFVGVALATRLHDKGEYFYNLAQRELDQYLISIFD